ncbi:MULTISPECIES: ABC transporter permease subunit [unclassified Exiguobacterium]|uniref:ABC transporter permease subunit n=1 Tax=unclassified Exiguobacterium TaxID=2644629 RepID=UPI000B597237|nr:MULTISPECIES: ABC transporter permease subunit [unclassified Exiguobacterium]ASI35064.1 permease [Exiguobacterium sp. N4-1P]
MNLALYRHMMQLHLKMFFGFGVGSAMYVTLITSLYPLLDDNMEQIDDMMQILPEGMMRAFGMESISNYGQFISAEYYGLFYLLILGVFSVMVAIQLVARLVDRGSMAYLLSTQVSRTKVIVTQMLVLISGLIVIHVLTFAGGALAARFLIDTDRIALTEFFQINYVGFCLFLAVSGYSFLISCLFNDEKNAFAVAGGITFLFYGMNMMGKIVTKIDWIRHFTPFSLYEPGKIASGEGEVLVSVIILILIGLLSYGLAIVLFRKRNLPL